MLKLGDKIISKICLGDKVFSKVCLGEKLVFQDSKPIFLDYVVLDVNSWINTEFKPNPYTTRVVMDFMLLDGTMQNQPIFGSRPTNGATIDSFNVLYNNAYLAKKLRLDCTGDYSVATSNLTANTRITLDCHNNKAIVNGTTYTSKVDKSSCTYSDFEMYLGNINSAGKPFSTGCNIAVSSWQIYDDGTLVQDLRPSIDSNGVVCFYDLVTKKYFYNQGTGTLKASGRFVTSILFDGASYIDTGIQYQTCTVKTETKFSLTGTRQLMGFSGSSPIHYWGCNTNGYLDPLTSVSGLEFKEIEVAYNKDDADNKTLTITVDGKSAVKTGKIDTTKSYLIGCLDTSSYFAQCEVKYNEIYVNGELIQDLRPYVDENGKAYFKDLVTGDLFYNKGTGTLGYTE